MEMPEADEPLTAVEVLAAMVAMFDSGDPTHAGRVVANAYVDQQGLGQGPIRGVDGFARVVITNHAQYEQQDVTIEDIPDRWERPGRAAQPDRPIFGTADRAVARIRWQGRRPNGDQVDRQTIDVIRV